MSTSRRVWKWVVGFVIPAVILATLAGGLLFSVGTGGSTSASALPASALRLIRAVDDAELCAHGATGSYTSNLEDLNVLARDGLLPAATRSRLAVQVVAGSAGQNYFVRVTGHNVDTYVTRRPGFVDESEATLGTRCPYPISTAERRLRNG